MTVLLLLQSFKCSNNSDYQSFGYVLPVYCFLMRVGVLMGFSPATTANMIVSTITIIFTTSNNVPVLKSTILTLNKTTIKQRII